ncbi:MAG: tetratricopeptide repeat protein [Halieaceae bacterium]|nr:tetratricopeptide repeat protein [Halieaceae bacterium]
MNSGAGARAASTALALGLLLLPLPGRAHFPALYGKDFVIAQPSSPVVVPIASPAPMNDSDADAYRQQVEGLELEGGPYAPNLAEPLTDLARYYRDREDYREALALYERALHLVRVNDGLYSERQIPLVRDLLDLYRSVGDREGLDDRYNYFFRLYGSGQPPFTALRRRASMEYMRWQREAHMSDPTGSSYRRLVDLYQLNKRMLESLEQLPEVDPVWRHQLVINQIRNLYLLLGIDAIAEDGFGSAPMASSGTPDAVSYVRQRVVAIQRTGYAVGRNLLQDLISQSGHLGPVELAALHLELGDWLQWNELLPRADKQYAEVEKILQQAGELVLLEQWLGAPVELPANNAFWLAEWSPEGTLPAVVTVHFDISAKGRLSNIEADPLAPENVHAGRRIKRMLKNTHFRPRFAQGQAQAAEEVTRRYRLVE